MAAKFDFKAFFVNHSEKLVGGTVALLGLWGFASVSWERAEVTPQQLVQQAADVRKQITNKSVWPEEMQLAFTTNTAGKKMQDIRSLAMQLGRRGNIDFDRFSMPTVWNPPLIPPREKQAKVIVLAPIDPEVSPIAVPIALPPDEDELGEELAVNEEEIEEEEIDPLRAAAARKFGGDDGSADTGLGNGLGLSSRISGLLLSGRGGRGGLSAFGVGGVGDDYEYEEDEGLGNMYGGAGAIVATANRKVEWRAGISVRMIVDLREQRLKVREALHIKGDFSEIQQYVDYQQMHIERMQQHNGTWGDWEEVKLEDVGEVLLESLGMDVDIVSGAVTRPELTMPLPRRGAGQWPEEVASHTRIADFVLSAEEQEMQNQIDAMIQEDAEQARKFEPPQRKEKKGFTQFLMSRNDLADRASSMYSDTEEWKKKALEEMKQAYKRAKRPFGEREEKTFLKQFESTATADDRLLLVRFIDFTAAPGFAYRYRVRLEMYNPNFEQLPDHLESPELGDQETIVSDWSEPTDSAYVPMRYRNYATKVKTQNGHQTVDFRVYYEDDGVLPVMGTISVDVGMPIAGRQRMDRVDLEKQIIESGDVIFATDELLAGVIPSVRLNSRDHQDLKELLQKFGRQQPVGDLVSLVNTQGDIVVRYADEGSPAFQTDRGIVDAISVNYESWRVSTRQAGGFDDYDEYEEDEGVGPRRRGMGMGSAMGPGSRGNAKRRRGRGSKGFREADN